MDQGYRHGQEWGQEWGQKWGQEWGQKWGQEWGQGWGRGWRIVIALMLGWVASIMMMIPTALGQPSAPQGSVTADVVLDGRVLFRLEQIDGFSAQARANFANLALQEVLANTHRQPGPPPIRVRTRSKDGQTTVRANGRHLLTVTDRDLMAGVPSQEQAELWTNKLQIALDRAQRERRPAYQRRMTWIGFGVAAIAIVLWFILQYGCRYLSRRRTRAGQPWPMWLSPAILCGQISILLGAAIYICELFPLARSNRYRMFQFLGRTFTGQLVNIDGQGYSILDGSRLVLLTLILWIGVRLFTATVKSRFLQATIPDRGLQDAIATLMQVGLTGLGLFLILQVLGIDLSALAILASVLGVGLGFGLQNIANNFVSGWVMLFERSIQVGDFINLGDLVGTVERIGARSTEIRTPDRVSIIVPNAELLENKVINWSHGHPVSQLHLPLGVAYNSPIPQVHQAVMEVASAHPNVLQYPAPRLRFLGFGDSSLDFDVLVWIRDPRHQFDLKSDLYYMLEANFRRYAIEIPFPQRDLTIRTPVTNLSLGTQPLTQELTNTNTAPAMAPVPGPTHDLLANVRNYSSLLQSQQQLQEAILDRLIKQMRSAQGLDIQDRRFRLSSYTQCFVGSEAVTWLTKTQNATREAAIRIGQSLIDKGIFHHVTDEHSFKDEFLFYRFYEDE